MKHFLLLVKFSLISFFLLISFKDGFAVIHYVKTGGAGTAPYTSWATASNDLQAVINAASAGDEIWIATGSYKPNRRADAVTVITPTDRNNAFVLKNNVKIYGGFTGTETLLTQRNITANLVLLSGDIGTVGVTTDNCYHVVVSAGISGALTLLDGVTITRGNANASLITASITVNGVSINPRLGGGIYKRNAVTDFNYCTINQNNAIIDGGGLYENTSSSGSRYFKCSFLRNSSSGDGGGLFLSTSSSEFDSCTVSQNSAATEGGGIYLNGTDAPTFFNGSITTNDAVANGGGIANYSTGIMTIENVKISANESGNSGGGIYANNSPFSATNCLISGNLAQAGGGIWNAFSHATITNCTIAGNEATTQAGGIGNGSSDPVIQNCIIYGNAAVPATTNSIYNSGSAPSISYTLIQGGFAGTANVNADPLFVSPLAAASAPTNGGNYQLQKCSPALNGGNNTAIPVGITNDLLAYQRIHYGVVDMGAYELPLELAVPDANGIVYVDYTKNGNGSSWNNAVAELSDALVAAKYNTAIEQVWVAKGDYFPKYNRNYRNLDCNLTNRNNAFVLVDNLKLYGGFAGGETDTSGRNFLLNTTVLDGNINSAALNTDNCFNIIINNNTIGTTVLNGFTVTNAYGNGSGAMENVNANPIISDCLFSNNYTNGLGGAVNQVNGTAAIQYCQFTGNISNNNGGAIFVNGTAAIQYCGFTGNTATVNGGAIFSVSGNLIIEECEFSNNTALADGGAVFNENSSVLTVKHSRFKSNTATIQGGGIANAGAASVNLFNCDFSNNSAQNGGGVHIINGSFASTIVNCSFRGNSVSNFGGGICCHRPNEIRNCVFSGNYSASSAGAIHFDNGTSYDVNNCTIAANKSVNPGPAIMVSTGTLNIQNSVIDLNNGPIILAAPSINATYSLIQGGMAGTGNTSASAVFMSGIPGTAAPFSIGDYRLQKCSPGINAGNNAIIPPALTHDLDSNKRIAYGTVDMGAYETHLAKPNANGIVYVDSSKNFFPGDGSSWNTAVAQLADAMKEARENTDVKEIWVAKGTYKPIYNAADIYKNSICHIPGKDDAFVLANDVKIYGGFAGGETSISNRNINANPTIMSGDRGVINDSTDNNYHVLIGAGLTGNPLIDGFTIEKGNTYDQINPITVNGLNINRNYGGGLAILSSTGTLSNCSFANNTAYLQGGALYAASSNIDIAHCSFTRNRSVGDGGALYNASSNLNVSNSYFQHNKGTDGGAIHYNNLSTGKLTNTVLTGNEGSFGGALYVNSSSLNVVNTTIAGNKANTGGGIFENSLTYPLKLKNSIIWGNTANVTGHAIYPLTGNTEIRQSIIENGYSSGTDIITLDPQFNLPQPAAAAPTILGDYRLQACSPGLNAGNNTFIPVDINNDADSLNRIRFTTVDLGAFEKQDIDLTSSTWKGINTNWNDKINWCGGYIPADSTNVNIPVTPNNPAINSGFDNAVKNILLGNNTSITLAGTSRLNIYGTYTNNGAAISNNGTWVMKGNSSAQVFPGTQGSITAMHNLEVDNPSGVTLDKSFGITGALTARNGTITLNNDTITLKSTSTATARIDTVHSGAGFAYTGTGKFEIERFIPAHKAWRLLTAPVNAYQSIKADWQENQTNLTLTNSNLYPGFGTHISGPQTGSGFDYTNTNNPSMLEYNPVTNSLTGIPNTNSLTLNYRPGYFLFLHGSRAYDLSLNNLGAVDNTVLRSRGTIKTGSQPMSVAATGFTLVGNPYASAIDFDQLTKTNVGNKFTLWDPSRSGSYGYGGYVTFTKVGALYVAAPLPASASLNQQIQSGYAFFVEGSGTAGTVIFEENDKTDGSASDVFRSSNNDIPSLRINLVRIGNSGTETNADGTLAVFDESANNGLDNIDAGKKPNDNQNIGLWRDGKLLAIEAHKPILADDSLFIALNQLQQRNYKLEIIPEQINRPGLQATLIDKFLHTNTILPLTDTSRYTFTVTSDTSSSGLSRFIIVFNNISAGPVPVSFEQVTTICKDNRQEITFTISNEINIRNYEIEQSADGRHFTSIASVPTDASASLIKTYKFRLDQTASDFQYFRIRSNDYSGTIQYSEIIRSTNCTNNGDLLVYPNPVTNGTIQLHFTNMKAATYQASLFNAEGKRIFQQPVQHSGSNDFKKLNIRQVKASGRYTLEISLESKTLKTIPVIIQ